MGTEFNARQFEAIYPPGIENHYWTKGRNKILKKVLSSTNAKRIIEIGCGKGVVVKYLHNNGFNITGVELADINAEKEVEQLVRTGTDVFSLREEECRNVDTVMLLDVIEHIEQPVVFLKQIHEKFPDLKRFIITVPACQELFSNYDEFNGHFRRYDNGTLIKEFEQFKNVDLNSSYFFHLLYFPAKIMLKTKGKRPEVIVAPKSNLKKLIHSVMAMFFYGEYLFFPSRAKGTSLIIKAELKK